MPCGHAIDVITQTSRHRVGDPTDVLTRRGMPDGSAERAAAGQAEPDEYSDLVIPLNVTVKGGLLTSANRKAASPADDLIRGHVQSAAREGWSPVSPTRFDGWLASSLIASLLDT